MKHVHNGKTWAEVGREPYTNTKGEPVTLIVWSSECEKCGTRITCKTPEKDFLKSRAFAQKNCSEHKTPWPAR